MKVTNQTNPAVIEAKVQPKTGEAAKSQEFASLLLNSGSKTGAQTASSGPLGLLGAENQSAAALVGRLMAGRPTEPVQAAADYGESCLEEALQALDDYAQALADEGQTLKDLAPLAEALEPLAGRLLQTGREVDDPVLKGLLDQTAITATVEAMKFKRGDYV